jgi:hypothetical protein
MSEIVFLDESNVTVTNTRFIVDGQTYDLKHQESAMKD